MRTDRMGRNHLGVVAFAVVAGLGACGAEAPDDVKGPATIATHRGVSYYGACGNETLELDGLTYYPMFADEVEELDLDWYRVVGSVLLARSATGSLRQQPAVVAPGPGDDTGTVEVFADGVARFESDSGRVIWLTVEEHEYGWVC